MKIQRNRLSAAIKMTGKASDRKSSIPILGTVRLSAANGLLTVTGTDLTSTVEINVECEGDLPPVCVAPKLLVDALDGIAVKAKGRAPDATVDLSLDGIALVVAGPLATLRLSTWQGVDFPASPTVDATIGTIYDRGHLADAIGFILPAVGQDVTRYHLNGAFFCGDEIVATDGHRLHKIGAMPTVGVGVEDEGSGSVKYNGVIVPLSGLKILASLLAVKGASEIVPLTVGKVHAQFAVGSAKLTVKLIDAQFPPFRQVIPACPSTTVCGDAATIKAAFKSAMPMASDRTCGVKAQFTPFGCAVAVDNPDLGSAQFPFASVMVNTPPSSGDAPCKPLEIGFNARYWVDFLDAFTGSVEIGLGDPLDPAKVVAGDKVAVVMPMRI